MMHAEQVDVSVQTLNVSNEVLIIEVEDVRNLWRSDDWDRHDGLGLIVQAVVLSCAVG